MALQLEGPLCEAVQLCEVCMCSWGPCGFPVCLLQFSLGKLETPNGPVAVSECDFCQYVLALERLD